ncbi:hypothetical protein OPV22_021265 [Ensete ventricosum]|uniref:DYW domain-containing protein n=1 Tax=Ensete ventricosum TaxID=4639 RepID=A0AAV8QRV3_ENSVE|nr:hypothetical protein OPV22_021265 [Ensete ventricosum]
MTTINCRLLLGKCATLKELQQIHGRAVVEGLHPHRQSISCQILNAYARFGHADDARSLFREIPIPDIVSTTSLMALCVRSDDHLGAVSLFSGILCSGGPPDGFAVVSALSASGRMGDFRIGRTVHAMVYRWGLGGETVVGNALMDMYCRNGSIELARKVFSEMVVRDSVTWSSMLHGYMKHIGLESACQLFDEMPMKDTGCWTVMITGHVQAKRPVRALQLFLQMKSEGHIPIPITLLGVLSACADIGALDLGRTVHTYIIKINVDADVTVYNALVDMYSKSGNVGMAYQIFEEMMYKDVFTWTTMISGLAAHGDGYGAMKVFSKMLNSGVIPNEVTFVGVLSACSHSGLIHEGRKWFGRMKSIFSLSPQLEHYGCMVDLLGRAGLLTEAKSLIEKMDTEPDAIIWRSLLSACLAHSDAQLAEIAGKEIIRKEPDDDGVYVLLWNMYASSNRWEEALEMRKKMWNRKVVKQRGRSWIEVDGFVHEFLVEDRTHHLRSEIYVLLEGMAKQLKMDSNISIFDESDPGDFFLDPELFI